MVAYLTPQDINALKSDAGETISGLSTAELACPDHKFEFYQKYCYTDNMPICGKCAMTQPLNGVDFYEAREAEE